jgi:hypothetical protein
MDAAEVIDILRRHEPELRGLGVRHAALFGSTARGQAHRESDVDIMVDVDPDAPIGSMNTSASFSTLSSCSR